MARGVNKVILIGNLGKDPEVRYMENGSAIAGLTLATSDQWKDKSTGEQKERTEWHRLSIFGSLAEIAGKYLKKGSKIYAEGSLRTRKWQDQSGQDRYTTEVVVSTFNMLDGRQGSSDYSGAPGRQPPASSIDYSDTSPPPQNFDQFDDDIPF